MMRKDAFVSFVPTLLGEQHAKSIASLQRQGRVFQCHKCGGSSRAERRDVVQSKPLRSNFSLFCRGTGAHLLCQSITIVIIPLLSRRVGLLSVQRRFEI